MEGNTDMTLDTIASKDVDAIKTVAVIPDLVEEVNKKNEIVQLTTVSPEVFLPDDHIINTQ